MSGRVFCGEPVSTSPENALGPHGSVAAIDYHRPVTNQSPGKPGNEAGMLESLLRTVVKVAVASLIVGTCLTVDGCQSRSLI